MKRCHLSGMDAYSILFGIYAIDWIDCRIFFDHLVRATFHDR